MGWVISFLATATQQHPFAFEQLNITVQPDSPHREVKTGQLLQAAETSDDINSQAMVQRSYEFEKLMLSYVEHGEPERVQELFRAVPDMSEGKMAEDTLRQLKNSGICAATIASRAAIAGGLDCHAAFLLSDLYIQKIELTRDAPSLVRLRSDLLIDYAEQVQKIRYRALIPTDSTEKSLFLSCASYVSKNIYHPIRVEPMANALGYTRAYLCHQFKKQTGITLSKYIMSEKILEAQRMLEFTDKSLAEIADLFCFSSQSHFQTVFKRVSGETPMAYRQRKK